MTPKTITDRLEALENREGQKKLVAWFQCSGETLPAALFRCGATNEEFERGDVVLLEVKYAPAIPEELL